MNTHKLEQIANKSVVFLQQNKKKLNKINILQLSGIFNPKVLAIRFKLVYSIRIITKTKGYIMTIKQIYEHFYSLKTSSDKLFFIDELRFLTNNKVIKYDINFDSIEESIMNEQ